MKKKRRVFTKEFKAEAVRLANESGKGIGEIAHDLGLWGTVLRRWVEQARIDGGQGPAGALTSEERAELTRLRRENRTLQLEREILKKAAAFFAKESR